MVFQYQGGRTGTFGNPDDIREATTSHRGLLSKADKAKIDLLTTRTAWTALPFATNWSDFAGGYTGGAYQKDALGWVCLKGMVKKSTAVAAPDTICTLPAAFRPTADRIFAVASNGAFAHLTISTAGVVAMQSGANAWVSLDGIRFDPTT